MAEQDPYETLHRVRKRQVDLKAEALGAVRRDINANQLQRDDIQRQQRDTLASVGATAQGRFDAEDVRRYYQYERHLAMQAVEKDAEIARLRTVEDERRIELEEAMKKRRMVERLSERRQLALLAERRKQEQREMDEAAMRRDFRKRRKEEQR